MCVTCVGVELISRQISSHAKKRPSDKSGIHRRNDVTSLPGLMTQAMVCGAIGLGDETVPGNEKRMMAVEKLSVTVALLVPQTDGQTGAWIL